MNLVATAWQATGSPTPHEHSSSHGTCSRCGQQTTEGTPVRAVISPQFTAFDSWVNPRGAVLCPSCTWSYTTPQLRSMAHVLTQRPGALSAISAGELCSELLTGPLMPTRAVIVPLRPRRKHLIQEAAWGHVTVDDATVTWSALDAARLQAMHRLRGYGFTRAALESPAPPYPLLRTLPPSQWGAVQTDWDILRDWRSSPWFALGLYLTTGTTTKEN